jgi:hypothetical protein
MSRTAALGLAAVAALAVSCSVPRAESMFFSGAERPHPVAEDCERCHQEVYREWLGSGHARAFRNEAFQTASSQARAEACIGCHAPASVDATAPVEVRTAHLDEGVTCLSCHLSTEPGAAPLTMRGPATRTSPIEIHPIIAEDPFYLSSDLCGRCHELELDQWTAADWPEGEEKPTCQACHMPSVRRKVESVHDEHAYSAIFVAMGREQDLRRHGFAVPEDVADWLELAIERRAGAARIRVANRMPHALPTGAFGRRRIRVVASWPGGSATRDVAGGSADPLPAGATREIEVALPRGAAPDDLHVRLERWDRKEATWATLLEDRPERG